MRSPVGRYATALMNGEKSAAHGNLRLGSFAGLSMGPIARVMCRKAGIRRWSCVDSVKYFDYSYRSFNVSGPLHKTSFRAIRVPIQAVIVQRQYLPKRESPRPLGDSLKLSDRLLCLIYWTYNTTYI